MNEKPFVDPIIKIASAEDDFTVAKTLFQEYAASLEIDLCFQDFDKELQTLDRQYNKPTGALFIVYMKEVAVGCASIRKLDQDCAELKRMYVKPEYRKLKLGVKLLELALDEARKLGYKMIRLDSLPSMTRAQDLYRSFGFYEIPSYRKNPVEGAVYMERKLEIGN